VACLRRTCCGIAHNVAGARVGWQRDDSVKVIVFDHARVAVDLQRRSGVARLSPRVRIQGLDGRFGR
jgi:hypothetical protein